MSLHSFSFPSRVLPILDQIVSLYAPVEIAYRQPLAWVRALSLFASCQVGLIALMYHLYRRNLIALCIMPGYACYSVYHTEISYTLCEKFHVPYTEISCTLSKNEQKVTQGNLAECELNVGIGGLRGSWSSDCHMHDGSITLLRLRGRDQSAWAGLVQREDYFVFYFTFSITSIKATWTARARCQQLAYLSHISQPHALPPTTPRGGGGRCYSYLTKYDYIWLSFIYMSPLSTYNFQPKWPPNALLLLYPFCPVFKGAVCTTIY